MFNFFSKLTSLFRKSSTKKVPVAPVLSTEPVTNPVEAPKHRASIGNLPKPGRPQTTAHPQQPVAQPVQPVVQAAPQPPRQDPNILRQAEIALENRLTAITEKERFLIQKEKQVDDQLTQTRLKQEQTEELYKKQLEKLEQISGLDIEKAKQLILSSTEKKLATTLSKKIEETRDAIKQQEDELSKEILLEAIQHGITDYVAEYTVTTFALTDETVKGKIIGREGKNIRAFEKYAGVEIEMEDGNELRISSFDSVRREIARLSLEKLIKDGRIQPVRIEEVINQTRADMDKILLNEGKKICQEVGVYNLPVELTKIIGRFKYRFSYGQNLAKHTIEAVKIAVNIAKELKADVNVVRLGTLLHDIGKVINDKEGTHIELGVELLRQYKFPETVIACVAEHHEDKPFSSPESVIVYLGDAASGSRPGARYEAHTEYLNRMENIEKAASGFPGVTSVAAYQAGREVMVIVNPTQVSDAEMTLLAQNIADKLEEEAKWAGQIKVTVVRESRANATITGSKISKSAEKTDNN